MGATVVDDGNGTAHGDSSTQQAPARFPFLFSCDDIFELFFSCTARCFGAQRAYDKSGASLS